MILKQGVKIVGVQAQIWYFLGFADHVHRQMFGTPLTVTALTDGQHNPGSLHCKGLAVDIRLRDLTSPADASQFYEALKTSLDNEGFDIVLEGENPGETTTPFTTGEHVHAEYDPHMGDKDFFSFEGGNQVCDPEIT